mgnify:FL=1
MTDSPFGGPRQDPAGGAGRPEENGEAQEGMVFRDKRRIDPDTYEPRTPPPPVGEQAQPPTQPALPDENAAQVAELTADLQRVTAEYANYRKRVDRDRDSQRELTLAVAMTELLPILDDIGRAREHGELDGGFKAVAESIEAVTVKNGVVAFGEVGEAFDPTVHEAMTSETGPDVTEPTVTTVYQVVYRLKDRVLRPARVGVTDAE